MNVFNRIVIILLILTAMVLIPLVLIFPEQAQLVLRQGADIIQANLDWLNTLSSTAQIGVRLLLAAAGMVVFLIGLLVLVLEVIRIRRTTVRLKDGSGELMMNGIAGHLAYHIDLLPDVLRVRPSVQSTGKHVRAGLYVETAPGVNVLEKSAEVREMAREVLEDQLGLQVKGEVKVVVKPVLAPKAEQAPRPARKAAPQPPEEEAPAWTFPAEEPPAEAETPSVTFTEPESDRGQDASGTWIEVKGPKDTEE